MKKSCCLCWGFIAVLVCISVSQAQECASCAYVIPDTTLVIGEDIQDVPVLVTNEEIPLFGLSIALGYDPAAIQVLEGIRGEMAESADFFEGDVDPDGGLVAFGIVYDVGGNFSEKVLLPGKNHVVVVLKVNAVATENTMTTMTFQQVSIESLSQHDLDNVMAEENGAAIYPRLENGTLTIEEQLTPAFLRADTNDDGGVNISDGTYILNFLFLGGPDARCRDSMDCNDNGEVNLTDGVYIFNYLFLGGPDPLPPFPLEGADTTTDELPECVE